MVDPSKQTASPPAPERDGEAQSKARARQHVELAFRAAGWKVSRPGADPAPDLLCRKGKLAFTLLIQVATGRARRSVLRGLLADGILQARTMASAHNASPLVVIVAPALSNEMVADLRSYVDAHANGMAWGVIDARGRFQLFADELDGISPPEDSPWTETIAEHHRDKHSPVNNPFTDLGQWMLKVMLAPNIARKNRHWLGYSPPPNSMIRGVTDLAQQAKVSASSASKFLQALGSLGHLQDVPGKGLKLVRVESLFDSWRIASQGPWKEQSARLLLPAKDPFQRLNDALEKRPNGQPSEFRSEVVSRLGDPGEQACLALFSAAAKVDECSVLGAPVHLYAETLSARLLEKLGLFPVDDMAAAQVIVRQPKFPQSVFRAATLQPGMSDPERVPAADLIQCWLDISHHATRGTEQAQEIALRLDFADWS